MKTTLNIDDRILLKAKKYAQKHGNTLTEIVQEGIFSILKQKRTKIKKSYKLKWRTIKGRILSGVDISDRDSLYNRMEEYE